MRRRWVAVAALPLIGLVAVAASPAAAAGASLRTVDSCGAAKPGHARCFSQRVVARPDGVSPNAAAPQGFNPADLVSAYKLPALPSAGTTFASNGQTIAIVDAFDNPSAAQDLLAYRTQFRLPLCSGGTVSCLFTKLDQRGGTQYPQPNKGWALEIALDIEMASAGCPMCKIMLIEADDSSFGNLGAAVNRAAALGATVISNSYGGSEFLQEVSADASFFTHPHVAITASTGDSGFGVSFPASGKQVIAVGGTSLTKAPATTRGWKEKAWSGAGSGCSNFIAKPSWQKDKGCSRRTVADVSAVANPATGVSVYDIFNSPGSPWLVVGGTSVSAPLIAGVIGQADDAADVTGGSIYARAGKLFDVKGGSNGTCTKTYLCKAVAGYDGPTGLGTPKGLGAFVGP
jgi:subtilase family serine protease